MEVNKQNHGPQIIPRTAAAQGRERPTTQKASATHQTASLGTSRANLHLSQGPGAAPRNLRFARGLDAPSGEFPPRSRARLPLRRVPTSLEGPSLSSEFPSRSRGCSRPTTPHLLPRPEH
jgi:hypothetical protein